MNWCNRTGGNVFLFIFFFWKPNRQNRTVYSITVYEPNRAYEPENWNLTESNRTVTIIRRIVCVRVLVHMISFNPTTVRMVHSSKKVSNSFEHDVIVG